MASISGSRSERRLCTHPSPTRVGSWWASTRLICERAEGIHQVCVSHSEAVVSDSSTPWTVARQAPLSPGFSRQGHRSGWPFPSPGDPPDPGIKPASPALQADSLLSDPPGNLS